MIKNVIKKLITLYGSSIAWRSLAKGEKKLIILMYHRILPASDPRILTEEPGMIVTQESFAMHLEVIENAGPVMTPTDWLNTADEEKPQIAFSITFDDGWLDNYQYAFPLLKQKSMRSTLYVVTNCLGQPSPFWPNTVLKLLLSPEQFPDFDWTELNRLIGNVPELPMSKEEAAITVKALKQHSDTQIIAALEGATSSTTAVDMINQTQLLDAIENFDVEVGCHTQNHRRLVSGLSAETLSAEIAQSKIDLESLTERQITSFCYPNGDYSREAGELVASQYANAVTTERGYNYVSQFKPHFLKRIALHDDATDTVAKFKSKVAFR